MGHVGDMVQHVGAKVAPMMATRSTKMSQHNRKGNAYESRFVLGRGQDSESSEKTVRLFAFFAILRC